jgi:hypothetical protein
MDATRGVTHSDDGFLNQTAREILQADFRGWKIVRSSSRPTLA